MPVELNPSSGWLDGPFECPRRQLIDPRLSVAIYDGGERTGRVGQRIDGIELIRSQANFDSLAIPKCGDSHSPKQELRCDQGFRYVKILMVNVSGAWRGRRRMQPKYDACWHSAHSTTTAHAQMRSVSAMCWGVSRP